jgi:uncharacterized cupin superfamily protein
VGEYATNIWDEVPDWGGLGARKLVRSPSNALGASIWEFQPGSTQFVYHFHHGGEELLIVLRGTPTVLMHDGDRVLKEGDVLPFPRGPEGGHRQASFGNTGAVHVLRQLFLSRSARG